MVKLLPDVEMAELLSGENEGRNPLNTENGGCPVDEFLLLLQINSIKYNQSNQSSEG